MVPTYEFQPVAPCDALNGVAAVKPLPDGLLDPKRWDIPNAHRLSDLTGVYPTAVAFRTWASETLGLWEHYWSVRPTGEHGVNSARARVETSRRFHSAVEERAEIRAAVAPLLLAGMTLPQVAAAIDMPLRDLCGHLFGPRYKSRTELYVEIEAAILAGENVPRTKVRCVAKYGCDAQKVTAYLLEVHGLLSRSETVAA